MKNIGLPGWLMLILVLLCAAVVIKGLQKALHLTSLNKHEQQSMLTRTILVIAGWLVVLAILASAGFFRDFSALPPRPALTMLVPAIFILALSFRKKWVELLQVIPPHWLVVMQGFRILVELQLWLAFTKGLLPVQMTFEGQNYDILSGLLALVAAWLMTRYAQHWKTIAVIYNITGLALLLNILVVAVLSMPGPLRHFMNEPANTMVAEFPFVYLPGALVVLAITLHIFSLRQVFLRSRYPVSMPA